MKINILDLKYYFLTCNNPVRKSHMLKEFSDLDLMEINSIIGIGKNKSLGIGFSRMLDAAAQDQDYTKPFQPFMIFEDDVTKFREFPKMINIPDDTDILYTGISGWEICYPVMEFWFVLFEVCYHYKNVEWKLILKIIMVIYFFLIYNHI